LLHRTCILLLILISSSNLFASKGMDSPYLNSYQTPKYSKKEKRAARLLEDYLWSLRKNLKKRTYENYKALKKGNTPLYRRYRGLLYQGISSKKRQCKFNPSTDPISKKLQQLIYKKCRENETNTLLKKKGSLSSTDIKVLKSNFSELINYKNKKAFYRRIKSLNPRDRILVSDLIKSYIQNTKLLPPKEFLEFMIVDHAITQFIQDNKLFEQREKKLYSKEFKYLVNRFKEQFLNGDESQAKEALSLAINFYENNRLKIDPDKAWMLFIISGKKLARKHEYGLAIDMFKLSEKIANEENQYESKFQTLFALYRDQKLDRAREFIREQELIENYPDIGSKLRFWIANIYDQSKEYKKAKELYLKQISHSPLNYYSIISLRKLRRLAPHYDTNLLVSATEANQNHPSLSKVGKEYLKLYGLFLESNSHSLAEIMAVSLRRMPSTSFFSFNSNKELKKSESLKAYFLITYFSTRGEHLHSFKEAYSKLNRGKLELNSQVVEALFPDEFSAIVKRSTGSLDHRFVLSLIRQESAFNKKAKSIVGARGLMQIMPRTGQQFVRNLKAHHLYQPKLNVRIGAQFLRSLIKRFEGNFIFALAAYNAGLGNVSRWLKTIPFSGDMLANIEMIPFKETRNYVKLIYRNYFFYRYKEGNTESLDIPTNQTFNIALAD
jgi:soluble lytic murein transglycosylase